MNNISSTLSKYLTQITDFDPQQMMMKRIAFAKYHNERVSFLKNIEGKAGYTESVIEYDKQFLNQSLYNY